MTQERPASTPSVQQLTALLDRDPAAVVVSDLESGRILYANRLAREALMPETDAGGSFCYSAAGFSCRCPFCPRETVGRDEQVSQEYRHPVTGRVYRLSGARTDWGDRPAYIEYAYDITRQKQEKEQADQREKVLKDSFDSVPCGLGVYRVQWPKIEPLFHNPAFYEIMGFSQENIRIITQQTDFIDVYPEDLERLRETLSRTYRNGGVFQQTFRLWHDRRKEYRWISMEGAFQDVGSGAKILYGSYSDISERCRLAEELSAANGKMQDIVNAIPGGVAIYRVSDRFEPVYFSDGVPALTGYTAEEYRRLMQEDPARMICPEDAEMVADSLRAALAQKTAADFDFRKQHRDGRVVWVHVQAKQAGEDRGCPLLQCVFHNITALRRPSWSSTIW